MPKKKCATDSKGRKTGARGSGSANAVRKDSLEARVERLEQEVKELSGALRPRVSRSRTGGKQKEGAKGRVLQLFRENKSLDYSDILEKTDLDLPEVVEICAELQREGKIVPVK